MPSRSSTTEGEVVDVVLIGGGIMSATLGSMLAILEPGLRITLLERADELATESSAPWNNAGTGHSGFCELNYMPDPADGSTPATIAREFGASRRWWSYLSDAGLLDPETFIRAAGHMDVVFGDRDAAYLRRRFDTLSADPIFAGMEFTEDPATIASWAPLVMAGRDANEVVAATRHQGGTDIDFGSLTKSLVRIVADHGGQIRFGHEVRDLGQRPDRTWAVRGRTETGHFTINARRVFVGAGGHALRLLQCAGLPEVRGYAVLPVGAAFLRCSRPAVVDHHTVKVYGQAETGAPPMSVPHLDRRFVDGTAHLMFGPYATFSTRLLKSGRWTDFFTTVRRHNWHVIIAAVLQNLSLVTYLIGQLTARPRQRFAHLRRYLPGAEPADWELVSAGQRAQLITPDRRRIGVIQQGTELVVSTDGTITGLLGASPGASTAVSIMIDLLQRSFPDDWHNSWDAELSDAMAGTDLTVPGSGPSDAG
ncbi:malate dehydrogenase (quinone) [Williamsia sp.]|uniref:malate dehydrogenase (quinone) n=1 Tax=Williamsia sp. TaxID=1872085 RepID=UPI0025FF20AC|nr:malate dehydrogenase (quinone) [Williamsia sp.]